MSGQGDRNYDQGQNKQVVDPRKPAILFGLDPWPKEHETGKDTMGEDNRSDAALPPRFDGVERRRRV